MMKTSYDPQADAYYARFVPEEIAIADTIEAAPGVMLDIDEAGQMVGIEVLSISVRAAGAYGLGAKKAAA
jgi:uncharacterized protein YuzE